MPAQHLRYVTVRNPPRSRGPSVTIVNSGTNTTTRLVTNSSGYYEAPLLLPGTYSVTWKRPASSAMA
jgi:hypothetical protein